MNPAYTREMEHAQRDILELHRLVFLAPVCPPLTITQLAEAIGLAEMTRDALLRAAAAREREGDGP